MGGGKANQLYLMKPILNCVGMNQNNCLVATWLVGDDKFVKLKIALDCEIFTYHKLA